MNKQTIEVLEETKTSLNKHFSQWGDTELTINPVLDDVLSTAIQALKALDQAEKVLPEKREHEKSCKYWARNHSHDCDCGSEDFNDGIYIAKPIIAQRDLRIGFLELTNRAINKELQSLTKENEVLREQNLDAVKDYKELQFTKARIKLLEQKLIDNNIKRGVIKNKVYTKSHYNSAKDLYSDLEWLVGRNKVLNIVDNLGSGVVVVTYEI